MLSGRTVRRPVAIAGGRVLDCVEKYDPVEQPRSHGPQQWQAARPLWFAVRIAARPIVMRRSLKRRSIPAFTCFSPGVHLHRRQELAVGQLRQPVLLPLTPMCRST